MIPERTLQEIQERLDIVEVIGGYVPLKKVGRNFKALCPFHPEKTPSFIIYTQKQIYICFGCHAGGDLISFVMKHEQMEFMEAVRLLAEKAGVSLPSSGGGRSSSVHPELYRAHEVAARYYSDLLLTAPEAEPARAYLAKRGLERATWETFSIGYAPNRWDGFLTRAQEEGLTPEHLERAGLVVPREGKGAGFYDRFRDRVIFPIGDSRGRVIAFGGRVLHDEAGPKYMNSPETPLYTKGRVLYGLHLAAGQIREQDFCMVVEGYMDLVTLHQHGIRNVVASMGTNLTESQVQLIRKMTRHVVMVYDGDYAGQMATLRGLDLFLEAEMRVKVADLPSGFDPDSLIKAKGVQAMIEAIQKSQDLFDYKLGLLKRRFDPRESEGRVRICEEMLPTIKRVPNTIQRGEYVKRLSGLLEVEESLLWTEMNRIKPNSSWKPAAVAGAQAEVVMTAEELMVGLLLEDPRRVAQLTGRLKSELFQDPQVQQLVAWMIKRYEEGNLPSDHQGILNSLPRESSGEWESRMIRWLAWADTVEDKQRALEEVLLRIQNQRRRNSLENLQASIRQAEAARDDSAAARLILEYSRLVKADATEYVES
ncbi:MAG: DNA primase [Candidatus Omnitrophica bacterium]|nr:DNA primase [Candidatus Omnitrophota bacterium]